MSIYETKRTLKKDWRAEGNPRLKGLLRALLDDGPSAEEIGKAWPVDPETRKRQLRHVDDKGGRVLAAPVQQNYNPTIHENFENRPESSVARTLAKDHFQEDDAKKFLAGEKGMDKDLYIQRALLQDSVSQLDTLYREELETTLIMGAAPRKIARDIANVTPVNGRKGDLPRGSDESYAPKVAQGATIGDMDHSYDTVPYETELYGAAWEVDKQLIAEAEVNVVEEEIRYAGARVENAVNRVFLTNLVENANQEHDTAGADQDASMLNKAIEKVELQNFLADSAVMHPAFKTDLFEDTNLAYANRAGDDDVIRQREFNPLWGLEMATMSTGALDPDSDQTWGFENGGEMGAVVYQREHARLVLWNEFDMETEDYDDPVRWISGGNVGTYVDSVFGQPDSAARIEY